MDRPTFFSIVSLAFTGPCLGAVLVQDDFSSTSGGLSGTAPDVGPSNWSAHSGFTFTSAGTVTNSSGTTNISATIDLGENYFSNNPGIYTLSVDVTFPAGALNNAVYGLGFAATASTNNGQSFANSGYYGHLGSSFAPMDTPKSGLPATTSSAQNPAGSPQERPTR